MLYLIYNQASIDSVITTAMIKGLEKPGLNRVRCIPAGENIGDIVFRETDEVYWVGVVPAKKTIDLIPKSVQHVGFFEYNPGFDYISMFGEDYIFNVLSLPISTELSGMTVNDPCPQCLLHLFLLSHPGVRTKALWQLIGVLDKFNKNDKFIPIENQAFVWKSYQAAIESLNMNSVFSIEDAVFDDSGTFCCDQEDVKAYRSFLCLMKHKINIGMTPQKIRHDNSLIQAAVININQELSPWVTKILSLVFNVVITFDYRKRFPVYTVFNRDKLLDHSVNKFVRWDESEVVSYSNQM